MKTRYLLLLLFVSSLACQTRTDGLAENQDKKSESELAFDQEKWKAKDGRDYPYRDEMLKSVLYNDSLRKLNMDQIRDTLGKPDRTNENYLYYIVKQKRLFSWPLHQKTLVFKFKEDSTVEWIKVHE